MNLYIPFFKEDPFYDFRIFRRYISCKSMGNSDSEMNSDNEESWDAFDENYEVILVNVLPFAKVAYKYLYL